MRSVGSVDGRAGENANNPVPSGSTVASTQGKANRLADEPSPYLRQHAHNPVDWRPWGDEAFAEARRRDVPVFLSIGYATCHWCHVMARESFEDAEVARRMNAAFVNVKVDREERPDVDDAYMAVCQAMTGSGGWPLTVLLTPDKKPFFAGTYFPKESRHGRIGMLDLVPRVQDAWTKQRAELTGQAEHLLEHVSTAAAPGHAELGPEDLARGDEALAKRFDAARGGFGAAPKFPSPHNLLYLLRRHARTMDAQGLDMVARTLHAMADGGIHDHLGGGFHRYSTDAQWLVPHFEKMLYDQAMLAMAYTEAFQCTREPRFAAVARSILDYVLRDLSDPAGGLRCAEDADSEGVEGKFYVWGRAEIETTLGKADADLFCAAYGIANEGNFHDESTHRLTGANILHLPRPLEQVAKAKGVPMGELEARLEAGRGKLLARRGKRVRPLLDDKVLTDWNGLAIAALAKAGVGLGEPRFVQAATRCATFLRDHMRTEAGRLRHRFHAGRSDEHSFLDDHAFLLWGLLELYDATFEPVWIGWAVDIADQLVRRFRDGAGGFLQSPSDGEALGVRRKEAYDGALPSGNSVAAWSLLRLARLTGTTRWEDQAEATLAAFSATVHDHPQAFTMMLLALDFALGPTQELVVAGEGKPADALMAASRAGYRPNLMRLKAHRDLVTAAPWPSEHRAPAGKAAAFLCEDHACKRPVGTAEELARLLG